MTLIPASSQNRSFSRSISSALFNGALADYQTKWARSRTERGALVEGNEDGQTGESGPFSPPLGQSCVPALPHFPSCRDTATRVTAHSHGCLPPLHRPIRFVCCARSLQTLAHCRPPPKHALVPRRFLLHLRDTPPNRLLSSTLPVGRTYLAKKDTRRLPHGSGVALASRVGCGRWDLLHVRV